MDKEVICDRIYENERGTIIFGKYNFSKKALLPTDVSPFSNESSSYVVDIKYYQCPPNYEWFSDWMVDMNGSVDEQGWSYNTTFYNDNWESSINKQNVSFVRRRKWMRMRRKCNNNVEKKEIFDIQQRTNDRQRLKFVQQQNELNENISFILSEFEYECSKLKTCLALAPQLNSEAIKKCVASLRYFNDKLILLDSLHLSDEQKLNLLQ